VGYQEKIIVAADTLKIRCISAKLRKGVTFFITLGTSSGDGYWDLVEPISPAKLARKFFFEIGNVQT